MCLFMGICRKKHSVSWALYNVEEKEAVKMMADTDKRRMTNYSFYTEQKWGKASNYTLCLNSSQLDMTGVRR